MAKSKSTSTQKTKKTKAKSKPKVVKKKSKLKVSLKKKPRFKIRISKQQFRDNAKATLSDWRKKFKGTSESTFDDIEKASFLKLFAVTGRFHHCCAAVDNTATTVRRHLKEDKEFKEAYEQARGIYKDKVHEQAQKLAITGVEKPIIGGRFRDEIVAYETIYSSSILAMEMKRTNPEYKESHKVDLNAQGGVMLIPAGMTLGEWQAKNEKRVDK